MKKQSTKGEIVCRAVGLLCLIVAIAVPIIWIWALVVTDPQFSMSEAEAVYDYTVRHTELDAAQSKVLNDAVIYAHGNSHIVRFLPWLLPCVLLFSALIHLTVGVEKVRGVQDGPQKTNSIERS